MDDQDPERRLLGEVLSRYEGSPSPRLREITEVAIRHLHTFVREVGLSHDEWLQGIAFLTETGKICDDVRQEFVLLSDTFGVSTLVEQITYEAGGGSGATPNTVLGPFYVPDAPERTMGDSILVDDDPGERVTVRGTITDAHGRPVPDAVIDVWQNASTGYYACQQPGIQHPDNLRGRFRTGQDGSYEFRTVRPSPYPIPDDGPVGRLLKAHGRNWMRPAHVHLMVTAPGCATLITHVFDESSRHLDDDAVFGVQHELVRAFTSDDHGELSTSFDVVLTPAP